MFRRFCHVIHKNYEQERAWNQPLWDSYCNRHGVRELVLKVYLLTASIQIRGKPYMLSASDTIASQLL